MFRVYWTFIRMYQSKAASKEVCVELSKLPLPWLISRFHLKTNFALFLSPDRPHPCNNHALGITQFLDAAPKFISIVPLCTTGSIRSQHTFLASLPSTNVLAVLYMYYTLSAMRESCNCVSRAWLSTFPETRQSPPINHPILQHSISGRF